MPTATLSPKKSGDFPRVWFLQWFAKLLFVLMTIGSGLGTERRSHLAEPAPGCRTPYFRRNSDQCIVSLD